MLKIDLLPKTIRQRRLVRIAIAAVVVAVAAEVGTLLVIRSGPLAQQAELQQKLDRESQELTALQKLGSDTSTIVAQAQSYKPKFDFIEGILASNKVLPKLYRTTAEYTYSEAMLLNLDASQNQLKFNAYITDPTDIARLQLGLSHNQEVFAGLPQVQASGLGYSQQDEQTRQARAGSELQSSIIGAPGAGGGSVSTTGAPSMMGGGTMGSGMMGGPPAGMMAGRMGGMSGGMMGAGMSGGMSGGGMGSMMAGMRGGGGGSMGGMGGGGGTGSLAPLGIESATKQPKGLIVTVTVPLKNAIVGPPGYGTSKNQGGAGGGGGGGGMASMMGGMMGGGGMAGAARPSMMGASSAGGGAPGAGAARSTGAAGGGASTTAD
jgi:Tfp pilus assembly protein PilN